MSVTKNIQKNKGSVTNDLQNGEPLKIHGFLHIFRCTVCRGISVVHVAWQSARWRLKSPFLQTWVARIISWTSKLSETSSSSSLNLIPLVIICQLNKYRLIISCLFSTKNGLLKMEKWSTAADFFAFQLSQPRIFGRSWSADSCSYSPEPRDWKRSPGLRWTSRHLVSCRWGYHTRNTAAYLFIQNNHAFKTYIFHNIFHPWPPKEPKFTS